MDVFRSWALNIGAACLISAVVNFLLPEGSLQKSVKFVVSIFTVLVFLLPVKDINFSTLEYTNSIDKYVNESELEKTLELQVAEKLSVQIKGEITAFLLSEDVTVSDIKVIINIDEEKNISIECIEILCPDEFEKSKELIVDYVRGRFNIEPIITFVEMKDE